MGYVALKGVQVTLEKRLGIAQLCLLLAVLVFIGLTRGAPAHHSPPTMHRSARGWNAHNLSFGSSTDGWNPLRRRSPSPTERIASAKAERTIGDDCLLVQTGNYSPDLGQTIACRFRSLWTTQSPSPSSMRPHTARRGTRPGPSSRLRHSRWRPRISAAIHLLPFVRQRNPVRPR